MDVMEPAPCSPRLHHDWSFQSNLSSVCGSPTLSSHNKPSSPSLLVLHHRRTSSRIGPRLSGDAFATIESLFDALSTQQPLHDATPQAEDGGLYLIPLHALTSIFQRAASTHLSNPSLSVMDKMFLTQLLCETYKLTRDVSFGQLVMVATAANASVVDTSSGFEDTHCEDWVCDDILVVLLQQCVCLLADRV